MSDVITQFNYATLAPDVAVVARETAEEIRRRLKWTFIDTGRDLLAVKNRLTHGQFGAWLKAEFDMTDRTAARYMTGAALAAQSDKMSILAEPVLRAIATAPKTVQAAMMERIERGDHLTTADVHKATQEARTCANPVEPRASWPVHKATQEARTRANPVDGHPGPWFADRTPRSVMGTVSERQIVFEVPQYLQEPEEKRIARIAHEKAEAEAREIEQLGARVNRIKVQERDRRAILSALNDAKRRDLCIKLFIEHLQLYDPK